MGCGKRPEGGEGGLRIAAAAILLASAAHALPPPALQEHLLAGSDSIIEHVPVSEYAVRGPFELRARVHADAEWVCVFYRCAGLEDFQARPMGLCEDGSFALDFDTSVLPAPSFEYYLAAKTTSGIVTFPESGRESPIQVEGLGTEADPEIPSDIPVPLEETAQAEERVPFPIQVSGSGRTSLAEGESVLGEVKFPAAGNVRYFLMPPRAGAFGFAFDSNLSYSNTPPIGENPLDLSNMNAALFFAGHTLRAGDLTLAESEYSVQGLGRRGAQYFFDNQKAYLHAFTVNSQQVRGFEGFGLPGAETALLGGAAGFRALDDALCLKFVLVTGRDSPAEGAGVALPDFIPGYSGREGTVLAVSEESRFFGGRLNFKAEFALSRHDADIEDEDAPVSDNALTVGTGFSAGPLTASAAYRRIGRDFYSIGLSFQDGNRRAFEAMVGLASGPVSLTGSFVSQSDNVVGDSDAPTTSSLDGNLNLSMALTPQVQLMFGYRLGRQNTALGSDPAPTQDSATDELSGTLSLAAGPSSSLTFSVISSGLSSRANPETEGSTFAFNMGGSHSSERMIFSPALSVTTRKDKFTGVRLDSVSAMTSAEMFLWPRVISIIINGSLGRSEAAAGSSSSNFDLFGGLNLYVGQIIRFGSLLLSLKGNYSRSVVSDIDTVNWRVFAQCDLSF
ncbi:MAG: hypothetical protein FJY83_10200 [Candidatus Aminicenantes bacterium]|nr:hypothetical protein [Candidatus Aminicenantes bacterium]